MDPTQNPLMQYMLSMGVPLPTAIQTIGKLFGPAYAAGQERANLQSALGGAVTDMASKAPGALATAADRARIANDTALQRERMAAIKSTDAISGVDGIVAKQYLTDKYPNQPVRYRFGRTPDAVDPRRGYYDDKPVHKPEPMLSTPPFDLRRGYYDPSPDKVDYRELGKQLGNALPTITWQAKPQGKH